VRADQPHVRQPERRVREARAGRVHGGEPRPLDNPRGNRIGGTGNDEYPPAGKQLPQPMGVSHAPKILPNVTGHRRHEPHSPADKTPHRIDCLPVDCRQTVCLPQATPVKPPETPKNSANTSLAARSTMRPDARPAGRPADARGPSAPRKDS